jgi:hypothetical protein
MLSRHDISWGVATGDAIISWDGVEPEDCVFDEVDECDARKAT